MSGEERETAACPYCKGSGRSERWVSDGPTRRRISVKTCDVCWGLGRVPADWLKERRELARQAGAWRPELLGGDDA